MAGSVHHDDTTLLIDIANGHELFTACQNDVA
jgi:hypothetical protein